MLSKPWSIFFYRRTASQLCRSKLPSSWSSLSSEFSASDDMFYIKYLDTILLSLTRNITNTITQ